MNVTKWKHREKFIVINLSSENYFTFCAYISNETWADIYNGVNINAAFENFINILGSYIEIYF